MSRSKILIWIGGIFTVLALVGKNIGLSIDFVSVGTVVTVIFTYVHNKMAADKAKLKTWLREKKWRDPKFYIPLAVLVFQQFKIDVPPGLVALASSGLLGALFKIDKKRLN